MNFNKNFYEKYGIKVTDEPLKTPENAPILSVLQRLHNELKHTSNITPKMIAELEHYVAQYPKATTLKNYLYLAYSKTYQNKSLFTNLRLKVIIVQPLIWN